MTCGSTRGEKKVGPHVSGRCRRQITCIHPNAGSESVLVFFLFPKTFLFFLNKRVYILNVYIPKKIIIKPNIIFT